VVEACLISREEGDVVKVCGNVEFPNGGEFGEAIARAIDERPVVSIDLSQVESIDSRGLAGLVATYLRARDSGVDIRLADVSQPMTRILQLSGLAPVFGIAPAVIENPGPVPDHTALRRQEWKISESVALAEPELVVELRNMAVEEAVISGFEGDALLDIRLACGEALVNALRHGTSSPGSKIRLRCTSCQKAFVIEVTNSCSESAEEPGFDEESSGLGLKLMKSAMDDVEFTHTESGVRVRMLKWKPEDS
jgi:anti-anti-sigma factor